MSGQLYAWRRVSSAKSEDAWPERLSEFADRLAITSLAGKPTVRVEVFGLTRADARRLSDTFGGTSQKQRPLRSTDATKRKPINIRGRLSIISSEAERSSVRGSAHPLLIPAGMAFGTGEHATTLNCLRFLADFAESKHDLPWTALDLGCGSGILALAARRLGAAEVVAADFDPECVRTTRENCRANGLRGVSIQRMDVLKWEPSARFDLVAANLYSTILVAIAPKLAQSLTPGGTLIFSGVLRDQDAEIATAFRKAGLRITATKRQGKWTAGIASSRKK